jgi:hypothetical protein
MVTADTILKIRTPEKLFPNNLSEAKKQFHELSKQWHPDKNSHKDANRVFQHITELYKEAVKRIEAGHWETKDLLTFLDKMSGKTYQIHFLTKKTFELGEMYIGSNHVTYLVDPSHKDLFNNAVRMTKSFTYGSTSMEADVSKRLPGKKATFLTSEGKLGLQFQKTPDLLILRDVVEYYGNSLERRHLGWILNVLYNVACYLSYADIVHHDISLDTVFISPKYHCGALLGGWWYAKHRKDKLEKLPIRTFKLLPWEVQTKKIALPITDLDLIRALGRDILGDTNGTLSNIKDVPEPITTWLRSVSSNKAVDEYRSWGGNSKTEFWT